MSLGKYIRKYPIEEFKEKVASSFSVSQVLKKLGLSPFGGNYRCFKRLVKQLNLDISHFTGQSWNKGKTIGPKRPIEDYLSNKQSIESLKLKKRLIAEGFLLPKCYGCNLEHWLGKPIPLELEHKDGNHDNNNLDNLSLLCPNCHAFTPTYRGRNKKRPIKS